MKIKTTREPFLSALAALSGTIEKRSTMPILENVKIECVDGSNIKLTACDLEIETVVTFQAESDIGSTTVPFAKLHNIVKLLPGNSAINMAEADEKMTLKSGKSKFTLSTLPADNFPGFEIPETWSPISVPSNELKKSIQLCSHAMAKNDVRYYLNGMNLTVESGMLRIVASDGHRLAMREIECINDGTVGSFIVPRKAVGELLKIMNDSSDSVNLYLSSRAIFVQIGDLRFSSKLIEGNYPSVERVLPKEIGATVTVDTNTLKNAISRVVLIQDGALKPVSLSVKNNEMVLESASAYNDNASESFDVEHVGELEIGFNAAYLFDVLSNFQGNSLFQFTPALHVCMVTFDSDSAFKAVVMPMKL